MARVVASVTLAEPSKETLPVTPPLTVIVRAVAHLAAVSAAPAVAGLPILTVCLEPPEGVTVKLPAVPLANV